MSNRLLSSALTCSRWICIVVGGLVLQGCTQWYYELGRPLLETEFSTAQQDVNLTQVLAQLGPPQRLSAAADGFVLAWEYWQIQETTIGFSLGFAGADLLNIDWGNAQTQGEFLVLHFDHQRTLVDASVTRWDRAAGNGQAIQPLFGLMSVVDVDDLTESMPQHRWGAANLEVLSVTLNTGNSTDSGQGGLEQRGTPDCVGQKSLE
jgi:hypothetical protein